MQIKQGELEDLLVSMAAWVRSLRSRGEKGQLSLAFGKRESVLCRQPIERQGMDNMQHDRFFSSPTACLAASAAALSAIPATAAACNGCALSLLHLTFPFLDSGLMILGIWRVAYLVWQVFGLRVARKEIAVAVGTRAALLTLLYLTAFRAGILLYLIGSFVKALIRMAKNLTQSPPLSAGRKRSLIWMHAITLALLLPPAGWSYRQRFHADGLERFVRYVEPGTGSGRVMAKGIAGDPKFNLERLRPLLKSGNRRREEIAYEILYARHNHNDALRFRDALEALPASEFDVKTSHHGYLDLWIGALTGRDKNTKAEFFDWLDRQYVPATDDEKTSGSKQSPAATPSGATPSGSLHEHP